MCHPIMTCGHLGHALLLNANAESNESLNLQSECSVYAPGDCIIITYLNYSLSPQENHIYGQVSS